MNFNEYKESILTGNGMLNVSIIKEDKASTAVLSVENTDGYREYQVHRLDEKGLKVLVHKGDDPEYAGQIFHETQIKGMIEYSGEEERKLLGDLIPEVVINLESALNDQITQFWVDFGKSVYDLHFEFTTKTENETIDIYMEEKLGSLCGLYEYKEGDMSLALGKELENKLCQAIQAHREEGYQKESQEDASTNLEVLEFELPAHWAIAFANSDYSGYSDEEIAEIEKFSEKIAAQYGNANFIVKDPDDEGGFRPSNDAGTLACDVITYQLIPSREVVNPADQISSITKEIELAADKKAQTQDL